MYDARGHGRSRLSTAPTAEVCNRLEGEWTAYSLRPNAGRADVAEWGRCEPVLLGLSSLGEVVDRVRWDGYQPRPESAAVLSALLRVAARPLAARALLQALMPRIRAEKVISARFGHGVGEHWQEPADTMADLIGECFVSILRHAGEDHVDVARLVLQEATRRLRTARQVQRRYEERHCPLWPSAVPDEPGSVELDDARTAAEWLAKAISDAVSQGTINRRQAQLLYAIRVQGYPASEAGRASGLPPKAVYHALAQAEKAFLGCAA